MPNELQQLGNKTGATRLGFAVLFKFFQYKAKFPKYKSEIPKDIVLYISKQLGIEETNFYNYNWNGRNIKYHRAQIREFFGFHKATKQDINTISEWLCSNILYYDLNIEQLKNRAFKRFRKLRIEPPTLDQIDRLAKSIIYNYENQFFQNTLQKLSKEFC